MEVLAFSSQGNPHQVQCQKHNHTPAKDITTYYIIHVRVHVYTCIDSANKTTHEHTGYLTFPS